MGVLSLMILYQTVQTQHIYTHMHIYIACTRPHIHTHTHLFLTVIEIWIRSSSVKEIYAHTYQHKIHAVVN